MRRGLARIATPRVLAVHAAGWTAYAGLALASVAPGSTVVLLAWAALVVLHAAAVWWRRFVDRALHGYVEAPPRGGMVVTGSLSSRVVLDYDRGTAAKTYGGGRRLVRWLYRFSFQAPFPYTSNRDALEAAMHRRTIVGLLTEYWFGRNLVAPILAIEPQPDGRYTLVTQLVEGTVPTHIEEARVLLRALTARFLESGLPSWQVGYYNPRAIGNLIQRPDGSFMMIDLESNLVTPFLPPGAIVRAIRRGQYPSFDDIDVPRLQAYLEAHRLPLVEALSETKAARLLGAAEAYADAQARWFAAEPRLWSRLLRLAFRLVDVPSWIAAVRRLGGRGQAAGERFVRDNVDAWQSEGLLTPDEARDLRIALRDPEVALVLANLGAHLAITVPLRFPFGSLTRFGWTAASRLAAEWRALWRRAPAGRARRVHTIPVMFATLLPSVGSGAYLLAGPLRSNVALDVVAGDRLLRSLPFEVYRRFHVDALTSWLARPKPPAFARGGPAALWGGVRTRARSIGPRWLLTAALLSLSLGALALAAVLHNGFGSTTMFTELGVIPTLNAAGLLAAGILGGLAFRRFWRDAEASTPHELRAGSFLWLASGAGLTVFAIDDFLSIHERVGRWIADHVGVLPLLTNNVDDLITLAYGLVGLVALRVFRHEVFALRAASALYLAGVVAAAMMLLVDAYGRGFVRAFEFPVQVTAVTLLLTAHLVYYLDVRAGLALPPCTEAERVPSTFAAGEAQEARAESAAAVERG